MSTKVHVNTAPEPRPAVHDCITNLLQSVGRFFSPQEPELRDCRPYVNILPEGVHDYEPQVVDMLMDFVYSYSKDIIKDAQAYGQAAGTPASSISLQDVELAIRSHAFAQPFSLEMLARAATELNKRELPPVDERPGLLLPAKKALTNPNVQYGAAEVSHEQEMDVNATVDGDVMQLDPLLPT